MNLTCPTCGSVHSAEGWENDSVARQVLQVACSLPKAVSGVLLPYLGLFRPEKQALRWSKALKLVNELKTMIDLGHIQIQGKVARPCPPHLWAQAMEQMADRRPVMTLPLKNHNYLRQVAWQIADQADSGRERVQHQQVLNGNAQANRDHHPPAQQQQADDGLSQLERQYLERHGHLPGMEGEHAIHGPADLAAWARKTFTPPESADEG
jgi:hypothetical protein